MLNRAVVPTGTCGSVLVLTGGLVTAVLPASTPLLGVAPFASLRAWEPAEVAGLVAIMIGLALLAYAWLRMCRTLATLPPQRWPAAIAAVRYAVAVWVTPLLVAPPLFSRDGWSYAAQGAIAAAGMSPYRHGPGVLSGPILEAVDPLWRGTPTPYGPVPLFYGELMADVTGNPYVLVIGHRLLALAGLALLGWAVPRLAGWSGANPALATGLVLASPFMMTNGVAGLHNDLLMAGLMAAAVVVTVERGWVSGAAIGGLAAAVKLPGGLVCLAIVLIALPAGARLSVRAGRTLGVAAVSLGTLAAVSIATGLGFGWVRALSVPALVVSPVSLTQQLAGLTHLPSLREAGTVVVAVVALHVLLRWRTDDRRTAVLAVGVVTLALVALSPVIHLWYLLWPLPFLAALRPGRVWLALLATGCVTAALSSPLEPSLHGQGWVLWLCAALATGLVVALLVGPVRRLVAAQAVAAIGRTAGGPAWSAISSPIVRDQGKDSAR